MLARLTSPALLRLLFAAMLIAHLAADVTVFRTRDGLITPSSDLPIAIDLTVFYSVGRIVAEGDGRLLYDGRRLDQEEAEVLGRQDMYQPFAYPPFVALPYVALSKLPFIWALIVSCLLMALVTFLAVRMLRPVSRFVADYFWLVFLALLAYAPLHRSTLSGQNAAVSFLCVAGIYASTQQKRRVLAGVWLGFLMFKPQLAVPLLFLFLWRREWRTIAATSVVGGILGLISVLIAGPFWPRDMLKFVSSDYYLKSELECCGAVHASLPSAVAWSIGDDALIVRAVIAVLSLATIAVVAHVWRRASIGGPNFSLQFALAISAAIFLSPHSLFYDTTLLAVAVVALVDVWRSSNGSVAVPIPLTDLHRLFLIGLYAAGFLWATVKTIGFQPGALIPPAIGIAVLLTLRAVAKETPAVTFNRHLDVARVSAD